MSPTRIAPTLADSPVDGAPAQDAAHHAPAPFDPQMIAGLANAFFQAPPASLASAPVPFGLPVATPNLPDAPAPSVVTTAAPFAPARAPLGPPDIPPTTIPSVVPTPNIPAERSDDAAILDAPARSRRRAAAGRLGGRREPFGRADRY